MGWYSGAGSRGQGSGARRSMASANEASSEAIQRIPVAYQAGEGLMTMASSPSGVVGGAGHGAIPQRHAGRHHGLDKGAPGAGDHEGLAGADDEVARLAFLRDPEGARARKDAHAAGIVERKKLAGCEAEV